MAYFRLLALALAFPSAALAQAQFSDQSTAAGLNFTHAIDPNLSGMMAMMHAGGAVGDFDRDGWPDIFLLGGGGRADALYMNDGNGGFTDQAAAWGVAALHHGFGAAVGDYDNDGFLDIYITSLGPASSAPQAGKHLLYHNDSGTGFTELALSAGVATSTFGNPTGSSPFFGDYDHDGDLDLFVCCGALFAGHANIMFQNQGDGTFLNVTQSCGADAANAMGFAGGFVDLDGDLWPEVAFIADWGGSLIFANQGNGTFTQPVLQPPMFDTINGMGSAFGDFNNNLLLDIYVTGIYGAPGNILLSNQGSLLFQDDSVSAGVDNGGWGWGAAAIDADNDSWLDIAAANGWTFPHDADATRLFMNQHNGTYLEQGVAAGLADTGQGRTLLRLDYDRDGDEDLVLLSNGGAVRLYRNDGGSALGNWLQFEFDTSANSELAPDGIGTMIYARLGDQWRLRHLDSAVSYLGTHEALVHLGLGIHAKVDELRVEWPDGSLSYLGRTDANQRLQLRAGTPFHADELRRGQPTTLSLSDTRANRLVAFLFAPNGPGLGDANGFGHLRLDLTTPIWVIGLAMSDQQGNASLSFNVPLLAPLGEIGLQAVTLLGPFAGHSIKSNALRRMVQP